MQRQHIRFLILVIILLLVIGFILFWSDCKMNEVDQQMPVIGCSDFFSSRVLLAHDSNSLV